MVMAPVVVEDRFFVNGLGLTAAASGGKGRLADSVKSGGMFPNSCPLACDIAISPAAFFAGLALVLLIYSLVTGQS